MTSTATPTRMTATERREQLFDVTAEIVVTQGFHAVSIQSVARRAGISRPIVYEHFGDLRGLLSALIEREIARALEQVSQTTPEDLTGGEPLELMLESLAGYLDAVERHPNTWRLVLMAPEGAPALLRTLILDGRVAILEKLARAVRPGLTPTGETPDPELTAAVLSAISDEYARLLLTDPVQFPPQRLLAHARWYLQLLFASTDGVG